jgi:serine/threonine protein kinase
VDRVLSAYQVEELIGRGGMGEVYLARDPRLDRPVALKVLGADLAGDERFHERLLRESRLAAGLDHPNVVPIYEAGEAEGRLFIAMRYVDGVDLRTLLRRQGALAPERALALAGQVAGALDAAHARGLVHRDVKPSNVLVDDPGGRDHCYLADFGLTQSASDRGPADGSLMGTLDYVAPEQIRGDEIDGRADQYALACLLFECLTGSLPFRRDSGGGDDLRPPGGVASGGQRPAARPACGARRGSGAWDGQGPRRSVRELRRAHWRGAGGGRTRRRAGAPDALIAAGGRVGDSVGRSARDRVADRR